MKTQEEILKKVCRYKENDTLDVDDEISISEALESIKEFHDQFKVELSEGEINKMAEEYVLKNWKRQIDETLSNKQINREAYKAGFKQGLSYNREEVTDDDKIKFLKPYNLTNEERNGFEICFHWLNSIKGK